MRGKNSIRTKGLNCVFLVLIVLSTSALVAKSHSNIPKADTSKNESVVQVYTYPRFCPESKRFKLKANGKEIFVYHTSADPFAAFSCDGEVEIEIEMLNNEGGISINPIKENIIPKIEGKFIRFKIPGPIKLAIEVAGVPQLFLYANPIESVPSANDPNIKLFRAGQIYEVGELNLKENETLYIEGGAVLRGCIRAKSAKNIHINGFGVLDGGYYDRGKDSHRSILFAECQNSIIENIIMIEPTSWMIVLGACENITIKNVKELGKVMGSDGADLVGCQNIKIENCMFRNGDDCIAIKSMVFRRRDNQDFAKNIENIEITNCSFIAYNGGQAMEIGHELRTPSVNNIRFTNCDILGVHDQGGVFGIHNCDRAIISNVLYENIRVEHFYNKLIDFRIIKSRWTEDSIRGSAKNITLKNIDVKVSEYNEGYSISLIGGYDAKHTIENVVFDNFRLNGIKVQNADQLDLYIKQASKISFK